jgi:protein SCO1/2
MKRLVFITVAMLLFAGYAYAVPNYKDSQFNPDILKIKEEEYLGSRVPDIPMTDHNGKQIKLSDLEGKPLVISIIYYICPHSCKPLNEGLAEALKKSGLKPGEDFNVLTLSFSDKETTDDAKLFRSNLKAKMHQYNKLPDGFDKWIFATAKGDRIEAITQASGYRFFFSEDDRAYIHPNVYIFLSPDGRIMRYIFGLYPDASDMRLAILESADGRIGRSPLLSSAVLACFRYDSSAGRYKLNIPLIGAGVGLFMLATTFAVSYVYSRKLRKKRPADGLYKN